MRISAVSVVISKLGFSARAAGILFALACPIPALAQSNLNLETGLKPYGSYHGGDIDSVSMTNGNLTLHIPIASYPQRGALKADYYLIYNDKNWQVAQSAPNSNGQVSYSWQRPAAG